MIKKILRFIPGIIVPMSVNFLLTFLYARLLEPGEYGILNVYLNTIQIIYAITVSVFQNASLRFYSIKNAYTDEIEFITTYIGGNIVVTLLIIPISLLINIFFDFNWWIIILSVGVNGVFQFFSNLYRLKNQSNLYNFIKCFSAIVSVGLLIIFSYMINPLSYIWPIVAVYGSYGIVIFIVALKVRENIRYKKFSLKLIKESVLYGFPLIGVTVLGYIIATCDQYFLLYYLGEIAVGNYALGHRLVDAVEISLLLMILLVMTPELNKDYDTKGEKASVITLKNMINTALWIILPISFAIIIYSNYFITFIFPTYETAAQIMRLVVFASIFHGLSMFTCKGLELIKKPKYIFWGLFISAIVNSLCNVLFIPIYGINVSAYSSIISYILYNIFLVVFTRKYYKIEFDFKYFIKVLIITIITALCAFFMIKIFLITTILNLIIQGSVCVIIYILLSYFWGLFIIFK